MPRSRKSRIKKMTQAELNKAAELLHEAEQQNLTDCQNEVEAILRKRGVIMIPQFVFRGMETLPQILFLPKSALQNKTTPLAVIPAQEEEPKEESEKESIE